MNRYSLFINEKIEGNTISIVVKDNKDLSIYYNKIILPKIFINNQYFIDFMLKNRPSFEKIDDDKILVLYFYKYDNKVKYIEFILNKDYVYL